MTIDIQTLIFSFLGGLAIFLFGMNFMSDGLKNLGSNKFGDILQHLTKNRFRSILAGMGITCLIQSSSATSVMVVGFVNAGLLSLSQAIAVVLGADIGTTFTAWIVSIMGKFKITHYALPIILVGFLIHFIAKKKKTKMYGQCILGFGFLFLGLGTMSDGFEPLKKSQYIKDIFASLGFNPLLGIAAGMIVTMILQSSSATIAVIQVMALKGLIGIDAALALMLGCGIGTTITAHLAAITGTRTARTVAVSNSLFKLVGTLLFIPFLYNGWFAKAVIMIYPNGNPMTHIAIANSMFNIVIVALFSAVLWEPLLKSSELLSYGKKDGLDRKAKFLDPLFLDEPPIAMQQSIMELIRMSEIACNMVNASKNAIYNKDTALIDDIRESEEIVDELQSAITSYLIKISERDLTTMESTEYPILLHCVNDIEKVGDYCINLANYAEIMSSNKSLSPKNDLHNIDEMFNKVETMFEHVIASLKNKDTSEAQKAMVLEDEIDAMKIHCRKEYISRLNTQKCNPEIEMITMDIASNIEKMADHLSSIAIAVIHDLQWDSSLTNPETT
jgi:phosphate:Na+ symporter